MKSAAAKFQPKPKIDFIVRGPPYTDFGSEEEMESFCPPSQDHHDIQPFISFGHASPVGSQNLTIVERITYDDTNVPPMQDDVPEDELAEEMESDDDKMLEGNDDGNLITQKKKKRAKTGGMSKNTLSSTANWGDLFQASQAGWKCDSCLCRNKEEVGGETVTKCLACEVIRPGYKTESHEEEEEAKTGSIGPGGFSFGTGLSSTTTTTTTGNEQQPSVFRFGTTADTTTSIATTTTNTTVSSDGTGFHFNTAEAGGFTFGGSDIGEVKLPSEGSRKLDVSHSSKPSGDDEDEKKESS